MQANTLEADTIRHIAACQLLRKVTIAFRLCIDSDAEAQPSTMLINKSHVRSPQPRLALLGLGLGCRSPCVLCASLAGKARKC